MKLSKSHLKQLIKEELQNVLLNEQEASPSTNGFPQAPLLQPQAQDHCDANCQKYLPGKFPRSGQYFFEMTAALRATNAADTRLNTNQKSQLDRSLKSVLALGISYYDLGDELYQSLEEVADDLENLAEIPRSKLQQMEKYISDIQVLLKWYVSQLKKMDAQAIHWSEASNLLKWTGHGGPLEDVWRELTDYDAGAGT